MSSALLERVEQSVDERFERLHGAHVACQEDAPFVTLICGVVANWDEQDDASSTKEPCPLCWDARRCPICGVSLVPDEVPS